MVWELNHCGEPVTVAQNSPRRAKMIRKPLQSSVSVVVAHQHYRSSFKQVHPFKEYKIAGNCPVGFARDIAGE
jgi:hypothetical protein